MNILMFTNTFTPHVGGVARSVQSVSAGLRERGHRVIVVAPEFDGLPQREEDVVRVPALRHFRGSDFSVPLPGGLRVGRVLRSFAPDVVHSHHPFLLGDTALRTAAAGGVPAVFTHHTRYEHYGHYLSGDAPRLAHIALELTLGYCNLCDAVIAPSEGVAEELRAHGLHVSITVIPTGVQLQQFAAGNGEAARRRLGIPQDAFVVGHLGRLAPEKNLEYLAEALSTFLARHAEARCLMVGEGPMKETMIERFVGRGVRDRLHQCGLMDAATLADTYRAMDVFAFSSRSETQGMVLAEAMASGVPVVALEATGVRDIVRDGHNGRLLETGSCCDTFVAALSSILALDEAGRRRLRNGATVTAAEFSLTRTVDRVLALYQALRQKQPTHKPLDHGRWAAARRSLGEEWKVLRNVVLAVGGAVRRRPQER